MNVNTRSMPYIVENVLRNATARQLPTLIQIHGTDYHRFRRKSEAVAADSTSIYGQFSGSNIANKSTEYDKDLVRIIANPSFWETGNSIFTGLIDDDPEFAYCLGDLKVNDVLQVARTDNKISRFKVIDCKRLGNTINVVYKFRISNNEQ